MITRGKGGLREGEEGIEGMINGDGRKTSCGVMETQYNIQMMCYRIVYLNFI